MRRSGGLFALLAAVIAIGVAGCGGSSPTPLASRSARAIYDATEHAVAGARSYSIETHETISGLHETIKLQVRPRDGETGTIEVDGLAVRIVGNLVSFYEQPDRQASARAYPVADLRAYGHAWLLMPSASVRALRGLVTASAPLTGSPSDLRKLPAKTIDGLRAVGLRSGTQTVYVATKGTPYPVSVSGLANGIPVDVTLNHWNAPVQLPTPSPVLSQAVLKRRLHLVPSVQTPKDVLSGASSTAPNGQKRFSAPGFPFHFDYPAALSPERLVPIKVTEAGARPTHTGLAAGPHDLIIVTSFPDRPFTVTPADAAEFAPSFNHLIAGLAKHRVTGRIVTLAGHAAFEYPSFQASNLGFRAGLRITDVFQGRDEYELSCQSSADSTVIAQACSEMLRTLAF
jgi:hypothetical protein